MKIAVLLILQIQTCHASCMKADEFGKMISARISLGHAREEAENIMIQEGITFTFDKYSSRYQATIADRISCGGNHAISLYIYIDEADNVEKVEAIDSYVMP